MIQELVLGFIAGVASRAVSSPLNIVTLRLQTERSNEEDEDDSDLVSESTQSTGVTDVVKLIYKEEGLAGFWRGGRLLSPPLTCRHSIDILNRFLHSDSSLFESFYYSGVLPAVPPSPSHNSTTTHFRSYRATEYFS
jgi:hypothetical protein